MFIDILAIINLRKLRAEIRPEWLKSPFYWLCLLARAALGGAVVLMYLSHGTNMNEVLAVNLGACAPLVLGKLAKTIPEIEPGKTDED